MKNLLIIALIVMPFALKAQSDVIQPEQLSIKFDSVTISIWDIHFKELSISEEDSHPSKELAKSVLSMSEASDLLNLLKKENSYSGERANLSHHDIEVHFFLNGRTTISIEISAMTGNININNELNDYSFRNNCSADLGRFILSLLTQNSLLEQAEYDEIDVEGLDY